MRILNNEQGSTSVLIILLMIVLMAFGVAALTTAHAGLRLTERNSTFVQDDYELERAAVYVKYDLLTMMDLQREEALPQGELSKEEFYISLYEGLLDHIYRYAEEAQSFEMVAFEEDIFIDQLTGGERIGTFHYQVASGSKEDKTFIVEIDVHLPDYEGQLKMDDLLQVGRWQLMVGSVGEANEDIFFEDPFEDPFSEDENPFGEDEESLDDDKDPFD